MSPTSALPLSGYQIFMQTGASGSFAVYTANTNSIATTAAITGLASGQTYSFKVAAISAAGGGAASPASNAVTTIACDSKCQTCSSSTVCLSCPGSLPNVPCL